MAATILSFPQAPQKTQTSTALKEEISALEARFGTNIYSDFLIRFGHRPNAQQAAVIGKLLDARVKADDGSLQPPPTRQRRAAERQARMTRKAELELELYASRLSSAVENLAQCRIDLPMLVSYLVAENGAPKLLGECESAIEWLSRFAEEWRRREQEICIGRTARSPE
jgi:hypothetical protein